MAVKLIDELQKEIKAAGEAVKQEAYEKAYDHVFQILDNLEKLLNDNRYLEGNEITEEDKRLYDILIRFDAVYYFKQRLNRKAFVRQKNRFDTPFGEEEGQLPVEAGRYRLLWAPVCPWAHRSIIVRKLLGLEDVISVGKADPKRPNVSRSDWAFTLDEGDVDPVLGIHYISEVYLNADPDYQGRFTVPALVDLKTKKVVNNDYFHLTLYFENAWKKYHKPGAPDLYPEEFREEIDALNDIIFREVNNGVYKAGFARNQEAYEEAYHMVFNRLDWLEERLADRRYLFGDKITESDVRLYVTLARFDVAYHNIFRVNKKRLRDYDNLWAYARDLYQTPGFGDTTDFAAIKKHYHIDCNPGNIHQIITKGPDEEAWLLPHGREKLSEK